MSDRRPGETTDAYNARQIQEAFAEDPKTGEVFYQEIKTEKQKEDTTKVKPEDYTPEKVIKRMEEETKSSETQRFKLGEIKRHKYRGTESPGYAARDALDKEKRLFDLKEGALVEIVLIGYNIPGLDQIEGKQRDKRQKEDTRIISLGGDTIGIGACYKIKDEPHPQGGTYRWVLPAVEGENYPETLSEFLIADETCKRLTPEQRKNAMIEIQITNISEEKLKDRMDNPISAYQTEGFEPGQTGIIGEGEIPKNHESEAHTRLTELFGEAPTDKEFQENPEIKRKRLSERLSKSNNDFKFS